MPLLVDNLSGVQQQATTSARTASRGDAAALASLCDAGTYVLDVCATLGAFSSCYPPGWVCTVRGSRRIFDRGEDGCVFKSVHVAQGPWFWEGVLLDRRLEQAGLRVLIERSVLEGT